MTEIYLQEKLAFYLNKKQELESDSYGLEEIESKVNAYRQELLAKVNEDKQTDIAKVNNYIDVISELINDIAIKESNECEVVEETSNPLGITEE